MSTKMHDTIVTISIDTEEDNWGSFADQGATTKNIPHLTEFQERASRWGARITYLVNRAPLMAPESVDILGLLADLPDVEIGMHCHPWNTPPPPTGQREGSMMSSLTEATNRAKIAEITRRIEGELGVRPVSFRAGRWGYGPTVSRALAHEGYFVDASISPFVDWTSKGGPDFGDAPSRPYRFDPMRPFEPDPDGSMVEIPTTVAFLGGNHRRRANLRRRLERSPLRYVKAVGAMDALGILSRRWLSPEKCSGEQMIRLAEACLRSQEPVLDLTFHSCTLLPGATPFVRDRADKRRFLDSIDLFLRFCQERGLAFGTLNEVGRLYGGPSQA